MRIIEFLSKIKYRFILWKNLREKRKELANEISKKFYDDLWYWEKRDFRGLEDLLNDYEVDYTREGLHSKQETDSVA